MKIHFITFREQLCVRYESQACFESQICSKILQNAAQIGPVESLPSRGSSLAHASAYHYQKCSVPCVYPWFQTSTSHMALTKSWKLTTSSAFAPQFPLSSKHARITKCRRLADRWQPRAALHHSQTLAADFSPCCSSFTF